VITKNGIGDPVFIEYPREQLMNDVIRLRKSLESDTPDQITVTEFLSSFYDKLLKESLSKLPDGVDTLILIPSGPLWYVPFSALKTINQETGTTSYLIEHYTIAYLPSLASLSSLAEGETQSPSTPFMALANPTLSTEQIKELGTTKYQYAQLEDTAEAIRQRLAGQEKDVYVRGQAQEPKAYQEIPVHTVEFYGCHGAFNPKVPLQSKLFLGPGESGASSPDDERNPDGNYHAWEALLTDHRGTELVILGACESLLPAFHNMQNMLGTLSSQTSSQVVLTEQQLKQIVVGDEVVGLARAFLSSGAEAVLGTLWQANPTAIEKLLVAMCEYHNQSYTWAQALTEAQRELITNNTFKSPWLWAPYQLIGRWR
jgi:CHAT domain-containing protein